MKSPATNQASRFPEITFLKRRLLAKTLFAVGSATALTAVLIILITVSLTFRQFERQANESLDELIDAMRSMAGIACFTKDATLAKETAQAFIKNSYVQEVMISAYGTPLARVTRQGTSSTSEPTGPLRSLSRTVTSPFDEHEVVGAIKLVPNWPEIERQAELAVKSNVSMMILLAAGIILVIALTTTFFVIRPVKQISDNLHRLKAEEGETLPLPESHEQNELGRLVNDVNDLVSRFRLSLDRVHDLHLQQVVHEKTRLSAAVFEHSQEGITITDRNNNIVTVNNAFTTITGYAEADAIGKNPRFLASGRHDKEFYRRMWDSIINKGHWTGELWNRCKDGEIKPKWFSISVIRDDDGEIINHLAIFSDITERKLADERIEFLAHHDALTHLPNRILTRDRFEHAVAGAEREHSGIAVMYVDLDSFKYVNDSFGHQAGDRLLLTVVDRMKQLVRDTDTISRQGGDEFLLILPNIDKLTVVQRIADQILTDLAKPFDIEGHAIGISASVGIALYPQHGEDFDALLKNADAAMYAAKEAGKNAYRFFTEEMNVDVLDKLKLKAQLRTAITRGEFHLVFQPQVDLTSQQIVGVEALIRWHHPEDGIIAPSRFIPIAEESGLINEIGDWVVAEACRQGKAWIDAGIPPFVIAVNVSSQQFNKGAILDTVRHTLQETGYPPEFLELEFTESGLLSDIEHSINTIDKLRALGIKLSIDDFGTGYSSLSYLQQFKVEKLKIDQSFVRDIGEKSEGMGIIRAIIQLGKTLKLTVIAEGVETDNQLNTLQELECNEAQGYLISKPLRPDDFRAFYQQWTQRNTKA